MEPTDTIKLLLEEFHYRHDLVWRLYFRSVLAVLTLMAIPVLYAEQLLRSLPNSTLILLFLAIAIVVYIIATLILFVETKVMRGALQSYRTLLKVELPTDIAELYITKTWRIGNITIPSFCVSTVFLSSIELYLLHSK
jgi:hypothetical protein